MKYIKIKQDLTSCSWCGGKARLRCENNLYHISCNDCDVLSEKEHASTFQAFEYWERVNFIKNKYQND